MTDVTAHGLALTIELTDAQLYLLAERVAAILRATEPAQPTKLIDAAALAAELGASRDTVYAHAAELGGVHIGDGARPRLRFDLAEARAAWQPASSTPARAPRRRRSRDGRADHLLPVRGDAP